MQITTGPLVAAGMPLQRVADGFLAKRMRPRTVTTIRAADRQAACAIARPAEWSLQVFERAPLIPSRCCQAGGSGSGAVR